MSDSSIVDSVLELAEIKYAELKGMSSCGKETARLELQSDQIKALLWALGVVLDDRLETLGLEVDALWTAVDPDNEP